MTHPLCEHYGCPAVAHYAVWLPDHMRRMRVCEAHVRAFRADSGPTPEQPMTGRTNMITGQRYTIERMILQ